MSIGQVRPLGVVRVTVDGNDVTDHWCSIGDGWVDLYPDDPDNEPERIHGDVQVEYGQTSGADRVAFFDGNGNQKVAP